MSPSTMLIDDTMPFRDDPITDGLSLELSPGAMLANARSEKGLSQEEIAELLKLKKNIVDALERDDYQDLPSPVFAKGYLRSYARIVGIKEESVVSDLHEDHANRIPFGRLERRTLLPSGRVSRSKRGWRILFPIGLVVVVVVVLIYIGKIPFQEMFFSS